MDIFLVGGGVNPVKVFDAKQHKGKKYGLVIQVVSTVDVHLSNNPTELTQVNPATGRVGGLHLLGPFSVSTGQIVLPEFADELWAIADSTGGTISVFPYQREA